MIIREDDLSSEKMTLLLLEHVEEMKRITPAESVHALELEGTRSPDLTFWSAWDGDDLLGCAALKQLDTNKAQESRDATLENEGSLVMKELAPNTQMVSASREKEHKTLLQDI